MAIVYTSTPIATDAFTRLMGTVYSRKSRKALGFAVFFKKAWFSPENDTSEIHIQKGGVPRAPLVVRGLPDAISSRQTRLPESSWSEIARTFPMIKRTGAINADTLKTRVMGEPQYNSGYTQKRRAQQAAVKKMALATESMADTCCFLASQSILVGKQISLEGQTSTDITYDFLRNANGKKVFSTNWSQAGSDPDADFESGASFVRQVGHGMPDIAIVGKTKLGQWRDTTQWSNLVNERQITNFANGAIVPSRYQFLIEAGFQYQFQYRTKLGTVLQIFTFDYQYNGVTDEGLSTPLDFMPTNDMLVMDSSNLFEVYYGPTDYMDYAVESNKRRLYSEVFGIDIEMAAKNMAPIQNPGSMYDAFVYDAFWAGNDGSGVVLRSEVAPIYCTTNPDAICTFKPSANDWLPY